MQRLDTAILRGAALPTLVVGVVAAVVAGVVGGAPAAVGAVLATILVLVFFSVGQVTLGRVLATNPAMAQTVALTLYLVKIGVLFVLLILLKDVTAFNTKAFALTILVCTITWTVGEVWTFSKAQVLYVEPGSGPAIVPPDKRRSGSQP